MGEARILVADALPGTGRRRTDGGEERARARDGRLSGKAAVAGSEAGARPSLGCKPSCPIPEGHSVDPVRHQPFRDWLEPIYSGRPATEDEGRRWKSGARGRTGGMSRVH